MAEPALSQTHVMSTKAQAVRHMVIYVAIGLALVAAAFAIAMWRE
jgi:hypothetical protein